MRFTWKGKPTLSIYPSNAPPEVNVAGPYPSRGINEPETIKKRVLVTIPRVDKATNKNITGSAYYDPVRKNILFAQRTCTSIGTSLPAVCLKKLPRPQKVWRKRLNSSHGVTSTKVTLNQVNGTSTSVTANPIQCVQEEVTHIKENCHSKRANGECTAIRRSSGPVSRQYCTTTREYLQKRCKTYDQNELKGKKLDEYTFTSGSGFEGQGVTGTCNKIIIKPSNKVFGVEGGVSSSSRTNRLKYDTVMATAHLKNYATARATLDTGYVNIKGQSKPSAQCVTVRQDRAHVTECNYIQ
jgi:hypothetical protein